MIKEEITFDSLRNNILIRQAETENVQVLGTSLFTYDVSKKAFIADRSSLVEYDLLKPINLMQSVYNGFILMSELSGQKRVMIINPNLTIVKNGSIIPSVPDNSMILEWVFVDFVFKEFAVIVRNQ